MSKRFRFEGTINTSYDGHDAREYRTRMQRMFHDGLLYDHEEGTFEITVKEVPNKDRILDMHDWLKEIADGPDVNPHNAEILRRAAGLLTDEF